MSTPTWFTQTALPGGIFAVDFGEPPNVYPFTVEEVLEFDDEAIIYEIRLARWRQHFNRRNPIVRNQATEVIAWLCMMRPQVLSNPLLFRLSRDWPVR